MPSAIDYHQIELTHMLESERYDDAINLLRFLVCCDSGDKRTEEDWISLLEWLESMRSELNEIGENIQGAAAAEMVSRFDGELEMGGTEETEDTESVLLHKLMQTKLAVNPEYGSQLLRALRPGVAIDKQILALTQLAYIEEPEITNQLIHWVETAKIIPWVQFKALQTLKIRGFKGRVQLNKQGKSTFIEVDQVPLELTQYPGNIVAVLARLQQVVSVSEPSLGTFAEQIWEQFLGFIYGTSAYEHLKKSSKSTDRDVWAAALHCVLVELISGNADLHKIQQLYGISPELKFQQKQVYQTVKRFSDAFPFTLK